jgi:hypothetical protein
MGRSILLAVFLLICGSAQSQDPRYTFEVIPASPVANEPFHIRVALRELSCVLLPESVEVSSPDANVQRFELHMADSCFPYAEQQRSYEILPIPSGNYTFELATCLHATPPLPNEACYPVAAKSVTVRGASQSAAGVPAISLSGQIILLLVLMFVAMLRAGRP